MTARDQPAKDGRQGLAAGFAEGRVEVDSLPIRYVEAGAGDVLVHLHGAGGLRLGRAHVLLAERFRVVAFETPGFGQSAVEARADSTAELARMMAGAVERLGIERYSVWGSSFGGLLGCWLAVQHAERLDALVLAAPAAIRPEGHTGPSMPPAERAHLLYAHPERQPPAPPLDPAVVARHEALVQRLRGPNRDPELERRLAELPVPTLVLFGTADRLIPPEMGRVYRALIPSCQLMLVYDAGHAIDADRPEAFAEVVGDFLERREQFVVSRTNSLIHP